jgi:hypothetical protein
MFSFFSRKSVVSTPAASTRKASHKGMKVPTSTLATQYTAAQWATMGPGEKSGATKRATAAGYMSAVIGGSAAKQSAPSVTVSAPKQSASKNVKASAPRTASSTLPSQYTPAEWAKLGPGEKSGATKRATAAGFASAVYDPKGDISAKTVRAAISAKSLAKNGATVQDVIEQARRDDQGTDEPVVSPQAKAAQTRKARKAKSSAINADAPTGTQSSAVCPG